ncbi:hypothetical protein MKW98_009136, partial [Papaver atlanticum]
MFAVIFLQFYFKMQIFVKTLTEKRFRYCSARRIGGPRLQVSWCFCRYWKHLQVFSGTLPNIRVLDRQSVM